MVMEPDTPTEIPGNAQYYFLATIEPHGEPMELEIRWPSRQETRLSGFHYPGNENFRTVLNRVCFSSTDGSNWERLTRCRLTGSGVCVILDPSPVTRLVSVGVPYATSRLEDLLAGLTDRGDCRVMRIGESTNGRPLHGVFIPPRQTGRCRGLFLLQAYQHYSEWAGLHALDAMLRSPHEWPPGFRDFAWAIVPCVNVDGLHAGWREDRLHRECDLSSGGNLNRDWDRFDHPETRAARDFYLSCAAEYPVLHALDLHMGWSHQHRSGGGLSVFKENELPGESREREQRFTRHFFSQVPIEPFAWRITQTHRPNFSAWIWRQFGSIGQTVEISRFTAFDDNGTAQPVSQPYYQSLGNRISKALASFYA